jgi:hypothetical protein
MNKPEILSDEERKKAIAEWNKMSSEERDELISKRMYYGIDKMIRRFVETGCYSIENPNQNQSWCSCGKPFCYSCVAWQIILQKINPLIRQAKAEIREIFEAYDPYVKLLGEEIDELFGLAFAHGWRSKRVKAGNKCRVRIDSLKSKYLQEEEHGN